MDLMDRADRAGLDPLADQPQALAAVAVVAHLGDQARLLGHAGHDAGFLDAVGHRLLDVHVLARPQRRHADRGVQVVGRGDHHRVNVLPLVEHHAEVFEHLGLGIGLEGAGRIFPVDVAQGDDVFTRHFAQVAAALAADADARRC